MWERALGDEHPDTAAGLNNLALVLHHQGKHAEAEPLYRRALEILGKALGPAHPYTATACGNLADTLRRMDRNDEVAELEARAGDIRAAHARLNTAAPGEDEA